MINSGQEEVRHRTVRSFAFAKRAPGLQPVLKRDVGDPSKGSRSEGVLPGWD